ncbi:MAG: adenylosuccinate lyase [bacterium JZ-2024 1]
MIPRYQTPEMTAIWGDRERFRIWMDIELAVLEGWAKEGLVSRSAITRLKRDLTVNLERIREREASTGHEVVAFIGAVAEKFPEIAGFVHFGITSSDVMDTAFSVQIQRAGKVLLNRLNGLLEALKEKAIQYQNLPCIGRTHGMFAEPTIFGLRFVRYYLEGQRNADRLKRALENARYGKVSGAVGNFANVPPSVEAFVCRRLGLNPEPVSSQIVPRDRYAEVLAAIALIGAMVEEIATEIRLLQRSEVGEAEEPFGEEQTGSSAMPHKRNPVIAERLCGLARVLRANLMAQLESIALWHERDISHSSVERIVFPDSFALADYMLMEMTTILRGLRVHKDRVRENLRAALDSAFSGRLLLELIRKGETRESAYKVVQRLAFEAQALARTQTDKSDRFTSALERLVRQDPQVSRRFSSDEIRDIFRIDSYLKYVPELYRRAGIVTRRPRSP